MKRLFQSWILCKTDGPKALGINLQYLQVWFFFFEHLRVCILFSGISGKLFSEDVLHIRSSLLATCTQEHK